MPDDVQNRKDREHLKLLSIFHFVFAGLSLVGIGFLVLHYAFMHAFFADPNMWKAQKPPPPFDPVQFFRVFVWFYVVMGLAMLASGVLNLLSAVFLRQRRHRTFSLVIAALDCLQIPFGTALGVFTIIVLNRDSVREGYEQPRSGPLLPR